MKKVLLPTDFSRNAWNAIAYALYFLKEEQCIFYLLNTYTPIFYRVDYLIGGPAVSAIPDIEIDVSLAGLERAVEQITNKYPNPNHEFKTLSAFNTLTDEVDQVCEKESIDLVIMGTKGSSGAKEIFLGSNTVHVIRKATTPVMAIPEDYEFRPIENVVLPTDYLFQYNPEELTYLFEILKKNNATLHIIHALQEPLTVTQWENKEYLKELTKGITTVFQDITDEYMPNIVHSYVEKHNIDLVAMMNRKYTFLQRLLFKQKVDAVGYHSAVPFLVLPDTSES